MRISDEKAREIAESMREEGDNWKHSVIGQRVNLDSAPAIWRDMMRRIGFEGVQPASRLYHKLADLIDRPTCRNDDSPMSDTYTWDWVNGMHIGYTPERIRVEGRGGAVEYVPDAGTCRNLATKPADELLCSRCGEHVDIAYMESADDYHARYCPNCGAEVVDE